MSVPLDPRHGFPVPRSDRGNGVGVWARFWCWGPGIFLLALPALPLHGLPVDQVVLARKVLDRLSVLTLMAGNVEQSIVVQKEAQAGAHKKAPDRVLLEFGPNLVAMLRSQGLAAEAGQWSRRLGARQKAMKPSSGLPRPPGRTASQPVGIAPATRIPLARSPVPPATKAHPGIVGAPSPGRMPRGPNQAPRLPHPSLSGPALPANFPIPAGALPARPLASWPAAIRPAGHQPNLLHSLSMARVSLDFRDVELADLIRLLAGRAGLNVVSQDAVTARTTVSFDGIPVGTALDTVLRTNGYAYELKDEIIWIFKRGEEPLETRVFFIRHAAAAGMFSTIRNTLRQWDALQSVSSPAQPDRVVPSRQFPRTAPVALPSGLAQSPSGRWSLQLDRSTNSLVVTAARSRLPEIEKLVALFDRPARVAPTTSRPAGAVPLMTRSGLEAGKRSRGDRGRTF